MLFGAEGGSVLLAVAAVVEEAACSDEEGFA